MLLALKYASCAKRQPHTIMAYQPGDENRSCDSLLSEVSYYHNKINEKNGEVTIAQAKTWLLEFLEHFLSYRCFSWI